MNINNWLAASAGIVSGMFFTGMALAASLPYTGGIALEKTEALARTSIPLPDGKPDALLAAGNASRFGKRVFQRPCCGCRQTEIPAGHTYFCRGGQNGRN
ncbi:TPA: hypothetical protein ACE6JX_000673 [Neisseria gonorrhoeae]